MKRPARAIIAFLSRSLVGRPEEESRHRKPKTKTEENGYLRLKFDGQYDNGDPYKDYELLVDEQLIPATRTVVEGPCHAIKGDVIRVIDDGDRFALRRGNKRIGNPEWWQLRDLFVGLGLMGEVKEEEVKKEEEGELPFRSLERDALAVLRFLPRGVWPHGPQYYDGRTNGQVFIVGVDIPAFHVRIGDLIAWSDTPDSFRSQVRGRVHQVPRSQHLALAKEVEGDAVRLCIGSLCETSLAHLLRDGRPDAEFWIMRQVRQVVSEPIEATSDEGALFELIESAGGRMPEA